MELVRAVRKASLDAANQHASCGAVLGSDKAKAKNTNLESELVLLCRRGRALSGVVNRELGRAGNDGTGARNPEACTFGTVGRQRNRANAEHAQLGYRRILRIP